MRGILFLFVKCDESVSTRTGLLIGTLAAKKGKTDRRQRGREMGQGRGGQRGGGQHLTPKGPSLPPPHILARASVKPPAPTASQAPLPRGPLYLRGRGRLSPTWDSKAACALCQAKCFITFNCQNRDYAVYLGLRSASPT